MGKIHVDMTRLFEQLPARLEQDARHPRLAMEADGTPNTKTRERTEGAATAVQAMHGDSCTAQKVQDRPKTSISFGVEVELPDLPCRDDVLVEGDDAAPKSCLPSLEMRSSIAAGGLVPTGKNLHSYGDHLQRATSSVLCDRGDKFEDKKIMNFNSIRLVRQQILEITCCPLLPASYRDNTDAKYDVQSKLCSRSSPDLPFLGSWRALLCGEVIRAEAAG